MLTCLHGCQAYSNGFCELDREVGHGVLLCVPVNKSRLLGASSIRLLFMFGQTISVSIANQEGVEQEA